MKQMLCIIAMTLSGVGMTSLYRPVDTGSAIEFKIKNLGFNVSGTFSGLEGKIQFDPGFPEESAFDVSIDAASVNTDNSLRDGHLKGESYFDVKNYPRIEFASSKITSSGKKDHFVMTGKLTIKNITKEISFLFVAIRGANGYLFEGNFHINRKDFNIGGSSTISNDVLLSLNISTEKTT
jgi:polyisoprenoid-binding protein YceI